MTESSQIKIWDPLVRFFHWALVSAFAIAYITEEDFLTIHSWAGYLILLLLCIRFVWGFVGTRYARFSEFAYSQKTITQFLKDTLRLRAKRYLGHNPAGGAMVFLLMFSDRKNAAISTFVYSINYLMLLFVAMVVDHYFASDVSKYLCHNFQFKC